MDVHFQGFTWHLTAGDQPWVSIKKRLSHSWKERLRRWSFQTLVQTLRYSRFYQYSTTIWVLGSRKRQHFLCCVPIVKTGFEVKNGGRFFETPFLAWLIISRICNFLNCFLWKSREDIHTPKTEKNRKAILSDLGFTFVKKCIYLSLLRSCFRWIRNA